jgi:arginase family enzyme
MKTAIHLNLDAAWEAAVLPMPTLELRNWGPRLRFSTTRKIADAFYRQIESKLTEFILYGSGDFHHLSALFVRRLNQPFTLVSFDNHPDWDVRSPRWCCGCWVNCALDLPQVQRVSVWGCGNFECWPPHHVFGNLRAERRGKIEVHPWVDGRPAKDRKRRGAITRDDWREKFAQFASTLALSDVYVTIDLDCLALNLAWTNWENGKSLLEDVRWALTILRKRGRIVAGDMCGAYSKPAYERRSQKTLSEADHPKLTHPSLAKMRAVNNAAFSALWPSLVQCDG